MSHPAGECPVCKKSFKEGDDIVTCPSCGAPYHRACYQKNGECVFASKHGTGFEYTPPVSAGGPAANATSSGANPSGARASQNKTAGQHNSGVLCTQCGTMNSEGNIFCVNCGAALHSASQTQGQQSSPFGGNVFGPGGYAPFGGQAEPQPQFVGEIDGIPKKDWAVYIGPSAPTYLMRMDTMQRLGRKFSFMFSAFFFAPYYFAYRKMWGWAALALTVGLLFQVPSGLVMLMNAGVMSVPTGSMATLLDYALSAASLLSLASQTVFALFALQLFKTAGAKKINLLRGNIGGEAAYQEALAKKGGVCVWAVFIVLALSMAFWLVFILQDYDAMMNYLTNTFYGQNTLFGY